ncbi:MAG: hypothetical protein JWO72_1345 [Caulobacteraceae bacterium]|nr:hypothetical protein [Caulobacteraceae bacterium]
MIHSLRSGVLQAMTPEGYRLPVIDITHPAFRLADAPEDIEALRRAWLETMRRQRWMPPPVMRLLLRLAARRSLLVKALFQPDGNVLPGLTTYVLKLGADNLVPPFDSPVDRRLAASELVVSIRLRLQQTARLTVDGLRGDLAGAARAPLALINIGGGPAIDSLNALIVLRKEAPQLLERPVTVHVLDPDSGGPAFGAAALAALSGPGGPLEGVAVQFAHVAYDWNDAAVLRRLAGDLTGAGAIVAASSEGALFEYADDDAVVANLAALKAGGAVQVTGSVTRSDPMTLRMLANSRFALKPRGIDRFAALAQTAGFTVAQVRPALISDQVLLRPQAA